MIHSNEVELPNNLKKAIMSLVHPSTLNLTIDSHVTTYHEYWENIQAKLLAKLPAIDSILTISKTSKIIEENYTDSINENNLYNDTNLIGAWEGGFGDKQLVIVIDSIDSNIVVGYDKVGNNTRPLSGTFMDNDTCFSFVLNEPGDDDWDGVFRFNLDKVTSIINGKWDSNNGKIIDKVFTLKKDENTIIGVVDDTGEVTLTVKLISADCGDACYYDFRDVSNGKKIILNWGNIDLKDESAKIINSIEDCANDFNYGGENSSDCKKVLNKTFVVKALKKTRDEEVEDAGGWVKTGKIETYYEIISIRYK